MAAGDRQAFPLEGGAAGQSGQQGAGNYQQQRQQEQLERQYQHQRPLQRQELTPYAAFMRADIDLGHCLEEVDQRARELGFPPDWRLLLRRHGFEIAAEEVEEDDASPPPQVGFPPAARGVSGLIHSHHGPGPSAASSRSQGPGQHQQVSTQGGLQGMGPASVHPRSAPSGIAAQQHALLAGSAAQPASPQHAPIPMPILPPAVGTSARSMPESTTTSGGRAAGKRPASTSPSVLAAEDYHKRRLAGGIRSTAAPRPIYGVGGPARGASGPAAREVIEIADSEEDTVECGGGCRTTTSIQWHTSQLDKEVKLCQDCYIRERREIRALEGDEGEGSDKGHEGEDNGEDDPGRSGRGGKSRVEGWGVGPRVMLREG